jgi:hypothetical protein
MEISLSLKVFRVPPAQPFLIYLEAPLRTVMMGIMRMIPLKGFVWGEGRWAGFQGEWDLVKEKVWDRPEPVESLEEVDLLPVKEAVEHPGQLVSVTAVAVLIC